MKRWLAIPLLFLAPSLLLANGETIAYFVLKSSDLQRILGEKEVKESISVLKKRLAESSLFYGGPTDMTFHTPDYHYRVAIQLTEGKIWFDIHRWSSDKKEHIHCQASGEFPRSQGMWIKPDWEKEEYVAVLPPADP